MWHEARRREKDIQKLFNEHKKRAERRREENPTDPNSLLLVNGIKSKINLDLNIYKQAAKSLVVWQGDQTTTIDRFDVRGNLSCLPDEDDQIRSRRHGGQRPTKSSVLDAGETDSMKKLLNFERYRLLIQADLNKVSEDRRLKLVGKSEYLSEAKMKKLENNWFGTSGETSVSNQYNSNAHRLNSTHHYHQQSRSQGVAIGYNYSQGPPMLPQSNKDEPSSQDSDQSNRYPVIDLDYFGAFDLDSVEKSRCDSSQTSEITKRYGLNCDEFNLLSEFDKNAKSTKEIMSSLQDLRNERKKRSKVPIPSVDQSEKQDSYGPDLPPEMAAEDDSGKPKDNEDVGYSVNSPPVRQRSPSGANIILRPADTVDGISKSPNSPSPAPLSSRFSSRSPPPPNHRTVNPLAINVAKRGKNEGLRSAKQEESSQERIVVPDCNRQLQGERTKSLAPDQFKNDHNKPATSTMIPINLFAKQNDLQPRNDVSNNLNIAEKGVEKDVDLGPNQALDDRGNTATRSRRAETPLAYKRYRRSSRSLSRDRRSSSRHKSSSSPRKRRSDSSRRKSPPRSRSASSSRSCSSDNSAIDSRSNSVSSSSYSSRDSRSSALVSPRSRRNRSRSRVRIRPRGRRAGRRRRRRRPQRLSRGSPRARPSRRSSFRERQQSASSKLQSNHKYHRSRSRSRSRGSIRTHDNR